MEIPSARDRGRYMARRSQLLPFACGQGVVDEIMQFAVVQTISGAPDDEHIGIVF